MFLLMIAVTLYACRLRTDYALVAAAVLVGTRPEGVFLAAPVVLDFLWHNRRLPRLRPTALAAAIFALPFAVNVVYYGSLLPATSNAKIETSSLPPVSPRHLPRSLISERIISSSDSRLS